MFDLLARANALTPQLLAWRRDFHRHPELGFHEVRTAGIVSEHLAALNIETRVGVGQTGVVGLIEGAGPGPTILLRFDMDALPIHEATGLPFASGTPGIMHACGHDGHTAIGMGVARLLADTAGSWPGRVKLLFQPAEEGLGGALATIADGVLETPAPDFAFALHLWNQLPSGKVVAQPGPLMAAADRFTLTFHGQGGHGALPHTTIDAILVASQAVVCLQSIVSRNLPPHEAAVLSVGSFHSGEAFNVIAEQAVLSGTLRTFQPAIRAQLIRRMHEMLAGIAAAHNARYTLDLADHTPAVVNDPAVIHFATGAISDLVSADSIIDMTPLMVAEDMAEIMNRIPGCYLLVGAEPAGSVHAPHHSPRFDFDERMLPLATAIMAATAIQTLRA